MATARPKSIGAWLAESPHTRSIKLQALASLDERGQPTGAPNCIAVVARVSIIDKHGNPAAAAIAVHLNDGYLHDAGDLLAFQLQASLEQFLGDTGAREGRVRFVDEHPVVDSHAAAGEGL